MNSRYFTTKELLFSAKAEELGIPNTPSVETWATAQKSALLMDRIREALGVPIHVHSWIRCLELNRAIGSKDSSQHIKGEAIDWSAPKFGTPLQIVQFLAPFIKDLDIDQIILEHTWIHTSFAISPARVPRNQILTLLETGKYATGITTSTGQEIV